ncbi:MAG: DUF2537 domain-containing protein [Chitinophagaceae bacterium]|nr:MAG: DUF2537 domain-containing protein [Chitinophagaceae bacterium]
MRCRKRGTLRSLRITTSLIVTMRRTASTSLVSGGCAPATRQRREAAIRRWVFISSGKAYGNRCGWIHARCRRACASSAFASGAKGGR